MLRKMKNVSQPPEKVQRPFIKYIVNSQPSLLVVCLPSIPATWSSSSSAICWNIFSASPGFIPCVWLLLPLLLDAADDDPRFFLDPNILLLLLLLVLLCLLFEVVVVEEDARRLRFPPGLAIYFWRQKEMGKKGEDNLLPCSFVTGFRFWILSSVVPTAYFVFRCFWKIEPNDPTAKDKDKGRLGLFPVFCCCCAWCEVKERKNERCCCLLVLGAGPSSTLVYASTLADEAVTTTRPTFSTRVVVATLETTRSTVFRLAELVWWFDSHTCSHWILFVIPVSPQYLHAMTL